MGYSTRRMAKKSSGASEGRPIRLSAENSEGYPAPAGLAVDAVVLTIRDGALKALVVEAPAGGTMGLPGGFVLPTETAEQTVVRKLEEKAGVDISRIYLEQLETFTHPERDGRGWIPSVAHLSLIPATVEPTVEGARWVLARHPPKLAYDHRSILMRGLDRIEGKLWWSNIAANALPTAFTFTQARVAYEAIAGKTYDPSTFARDLWATGLIEATGRKMRQPVGRPARLYRFATLEASWGAGRRKRVVTS